MFKRLLPFFITLAIGLFVASFFVDLSPTPFRFDSRGMRRFREFQELKMENMELRDRNAQLQQQIDQLRSNPVYLKQIENWSSPDVDKVPPAPTVKAPRAVK